MSNFKSIKSLNYLFQTWQGFNNTAGKSELENIQEKLDCCGFIEVEDTPNATCNADCANGDNYNACTPCREVMKDKINYAFNSAGGVGLFFAFTEVRPITIWSMIK